MWGCRYPTCRRHNDSFSKSGGRCWSKMSIYGELTSGRDYALAVIVSTVLRKKPRPQCRQIPPKQFWTIQILHHVGSATNLCAWCSKGWYCQCNVGSRTVGCCEHTAVLWYPSYQRNQAGDVLSETHFCGTVNVLEVVDTNWESKWRSSKWSTSIRFFIQSTKVHQHFFCYFHNSFFLIKVDFLNIKM